MAILNKHWNHATSADSEKVKHLSEELRMHPRVAEILLSRGFKNQKDIQSFLNPNLNNLIDPFQL